MARRRPGRIRLARALIFLEAAGARLAGPGRPEDEERESVQCDLCRSGGKSEKLDPVPGLVLVTVP